MQDPIPPTLKLYGTENYADWAKVTQQELKKDGLWPVVEDDTVQRTGNATSMDNYARQQEARSFITDRLGDGPFRSVVYGKNVSAAQLWKELKSAYEEHGYPLIDKLASELINMKWDGSSNLDDHVEMFARMMKRLNDATIADGRQPVPDWMQISLLLRSVEGVDEGVQQKVVNVLKSGNLRKKTGELELADVAEDFKNFRHFAKGLEFYRSGGIQAKDEELEFVHLPKGATE